MKKSIFFLSLLFFCASHAQNQQVEIEWKDKINVSTDEEKLILVPAFEPNYLDYDIENKQITYYRVFDLSGNYTITNVKTAFVDPSLLQEVAVFDEVFTPEIHYASARGKSKVVVSFNPLLKNGNSYQKVTSFTLVQTSDRLAETQSFSNNSVQGITNSVLASGRFYQFIVEKTGIQRINANFLTSLGINLSEVDPSRIKIFSHGGKMLPLRNSENLPYMFDPPQIPLKVVTQNQNTFQQGDEIYFYGEATEGYYSAENETNLNVYADEAFYYITIDGEVGKRVTPYQEPTGAENEMITTFDDYAYYEVDETSPSLVGRRWFGDRFDITTQRNYSFTFPNLITSEPIRIKVLLAGVSTSSSSMNVGVNNSPLTSISIGSTGSDLPSRGANFEGQFFSNQDQININLSYNKQGNPAARAFLDYVSLEAKRELIAANEQFQFQLKQSAQLNGIGRYVLRNASLVSEIWDISNRQEVAVNTTGFVSEFSFKASLGALKTYIAFVQSDAYIPRIDPANRTLPNSNLKGTIFNSSQNQFEDIDYLVITNNQLMPQAQRLADFREQNDGMVTRVVNVSDIYREFNSNKQDIGAIRNFIRYIYENASSPEKRIKYIAILGDASVDYKNRLPGNNNIVPTFQSLPSFSSTASSSMSDDYFTMMDPNEGSMLTSHMMDLAVGRILADTPQLANQMITKIIDHESRESYASWRNNFLLISDDVDRVGEFQQIQVQNDNLGNQIAANKPFINVRKIHMDAFEQISSAGGDRYPEVNKAITRQIELGVSVVNYFGHGGEDGLAQERVVTQTDVQSWRNPFRYNLFLTITCEFTKFDNPLRVTAGELAYWNPQGGPVAMITTTRAIGVGAGISFNNALAPFLFDYDDLRETAAEAVMRTKNALSTPGKRIVFYIGDPAMRLPFGEPQIRLRTLNGVPFAQTTDTLKALSKNVITGEIVNTNEQRITNYNGNLTTTIFDKPIQRQTLGNDGVQIGGQLAIMDFTTLGETLFRGQSSVTNGEFSVEFILPLDTRIPVDNGRISMYAVRNDILEDQVGSDETILVGGINQNAPVDNEGPLIQLFMNDETFVDGGITDSSPFLLAKLEDESGINTAGGIGHDILAILDEDDANPFVLNDYYKAAQDDFTRGEVYFPLRDIEPGLHTLRLRAWDTHNNSSEAEIQFLVSEDNELVITRVLNYPNPFVNYTEFWFNHNRPFEPLEVQVQVFTVSGKLVWTQNQLVNTDGFLSRDITWDGRDDFGDRIGKGVYVYKLTVRSTLTNQRAEKYEKLVIL
jgi:hypothetical protein